jgi:predicted ester cyclase
MAKHRATVEKLWQALESGNLELLSAVVTPDCEFRMPGGVFRGVQELWGMRQGWWSAFPDLRHEILTSVEDEGSLSCELHVTGTHSGPLQSPKGTVPASGKKVLFESCDYLRFRDGKVSVWHAYTDMLSFQVQLGLIPA